MKFKFKFEFHQTNIKPLNNFRKQIIFLFFFYTIFPVKKINVGKILKLRENRC
jgi:hypothetical protein